MKLSGDTVEVANEDRDTEVLSQAKGVSDMVLEVENTYGIESGFVSTERVSYEVIPGKTSCPSKATLHDSNFSG